MDGECNHCGCWLYQEKDLCYCPKCGEHLSLGNQVYILSEMVDNLQEDIKKLKEKVDATV